MLHQFTLLHLSDLHERGSREKESARRYRVLGEAWQRNLDELLQEGPIDLVCFTGDLADWGQAQEYEGISALLDAVLKRLGLGRERLFLVPGNHDIDRKILPDKTQRSPEQLAFEKLRGNLHRAAPLDISRWLEGGKPPFGFEQAWLELTLSRQSAYRDFLRTFGLPELLPNANLHPHLGYRVSLQLPGLPFPVQVVGLDSAWLAGDDADSGRLRLTDGQVMKLCLDSEGRELPGFRLALVHHPLSDLADASQCRTLLANSVDLLLRGHLHESEVTEWADPDRKLRAMAAGCLYEGDRADHYPNSCSVIQVQCDDAGRPLRYDVRLRSFSARNGHWFDDGGAYRNAPTGRLTIQLVASPRRQEVCESNRILAEGLVLCDAAQWLASICNLTKWLVSNDTKTDHKQRWKLAEMIVGRARERLAQYSDDPDGAEYLSQLINGIDAVLASSKRILWDELSQYIYEAEADKLHIDTSALVKILPKSGNPGLETPAILLFNKHPDLQTEFNRLWNFEMYKLVGFRNKEECDEFRKPSIKTLIKSKNEEVLTTVKLFMQRKRNLSKYPEISFSELERKGLISDTANLTINALLREKYLLAKEIAEHRFDLTGYNYVYVLTDAGIEILSRLIPEPESDNPTGVNDTNQKTYRISQGSSSNRIKDHAYHEDETPQTLKQTNEHINTLNEITITLQKRMLAMTGFSVIVLWGLHIYREHTVSYSLLLIVKLIFDPIILYQVIQSFELGMKTYVLREDSTNRHILRIASANLFAIIVSIFYFDLHFSYLVFYKSKTENVDILPMPLNAFIVFIASLAGLPILWHLRYRHHKFRKET